MKAVQVCLLALALCAPTASAANDQSNPLGKVFSLMEELAAKIIKEGEVEVKAYEEFVEWCDDASKNKGFEIKTASAKKEDLEAKIGKCTGDIEASSAKIEELAAAIAKDSAELKDATAVREKEVEDFTASEKELMDSIDTLSRAIRVLEKEMAKNPAALIQQTSTMTGLVATLSTIVDAAAMSTADKQKLLGLVQQSSSADDEELGAPAAAAYKSQSGGILDVVEDLKEKAEEELDSLRKEETSAKHNFEMTKQSLEDSMAADTKDMDQEKAAKAATEEAKATAEGDLTETIKQLKDAEAGLETAKSDCITTAADHEATVNARTEELKVIAEAKKILKESTSGAEEQSYSFLQFKSSLRSHTDLVKVEVATLVKKLAKKQHSAALAQLASRISAVMKLGASAGENPFAKVKGLIEDMVAKLEKEAEESATEKAYCDEQMTKTQAKSDDLNADIDSLSAKIDKATSASAALKEDVKELQAELAALTKQQAEMDKIRSETHADYTVAKEELEAGLTGVRKALGVLREYYGGAAAAASMLQSDESMKAMMQQPEVPEMHTKASGAGQSIVGILEVCESDFAKNLATEETEEADAQSEYEKTTQENTVTKTMKEQDVKYSVQEYKGLDKSVAELSADKDTTGTELAAVTEYFDKIKDRCIAKPEPYAERKARREAEISGLKEALSILEDETALVQRSKRGNRRSHFLATEQ